MQVASLHILNKWFNLFKGYYISNYKLACFVLYLKIINTFFEK